MSSETPGRSGVVTLGETMALMSTERYGPLPHSPTLSLGIGGAESNVAIGLRRLGVDVTWISKVGAGRSVPRACRWWPLGTWKHRLR